MEQIRRIIYYTDVGDVTAKTLEALKLPYPCPWFRAWDTSDVQIVHLVVTVPVKCRAQITPT